jgi:hypothetical protein
LPAARGLFFRFVRHGFRSFFGGNGAVPTPLSRSTIAGMRLLGPIRRNSGLSCSFFMMSTAWTA